MQASIGSIGHTDQSRVYGRYLPELKTKMEEILRSAIEEDAPLLWLQGSTTRRER